MENLSNFINTSIVTEAEWVDRTATLTRTLTIKSNGKNVEEYLVFYGERKAFVERFKNILGNIEVPETNEELVYKLNSAYSASHDNIKWKISTGGEKKAYPVVHI